MLVEKVRDLCSSNFAYFREPVFQAGFIIGVVLVLLVVLLFWLVLSKRSHCEAISVAEDGGLFVLSTAALKTFLKRIVLEFSKAEMKEVRILKKRGGIMLTLLLQVYPDTDVITLRSRLRERILSDAAKKLGVADQIQSIDIKISKMRDDGATPVVPIEEREEPKGGAEVKKESLSEGLLPPLQ
ncbi:MAG: hypothetical protein WCT05_08545 [Lentisphaeria bacterium]